MSKYFTCPHCGADVPVKALACPECGSDEETGWSEEAKYIHLLPDHEPAEEPRSASSRQLQSYGMGAVAVVMIISVLLSQGLTWSIYVVPLLVVAAGIVYYLRNAGKGGVPWGEEARLYRQLMERCRGDRERADRLIAYEQERTPHFNRLQLLQKALYRFERDAR